MQIDTGADFSVMTKNVYDQHYSNVPLCKSNVNLKSYTGDKIQVYGQMKCSVKLVENNDCKN